MLLDPDTCYRALQTRDSRFDGQFFTAVRTTKIFCRPVCPAPTPKRENCQFFSSAAAAHEAGFRPCLRCRPELSPNLLGYITTASTVNRALGLISEGALDEGSIEELATRLGVGERHLRRLFHEHLGVSPLAVAQTRRILFAKQLIDQTSLSMTDIAMASGFGSIRRFNHALRQTYQKSPSELRCSRVESLIETPELQLKLPFTAPYHWSALVDFLMARRIAGVEAITPASYHRTIAFEGQHGTVEVQPINDEAYLLATIRFPKISALSAIVERLRRLFDLRANVTEIAAHLQSDIHLQPLIVALPGLRVPGAWDGFEMAVRAILGQQVSVAAATTLMGRLVQTYGVPLQMESQTSDLAFVFPNPETLATADLTQIGLVRSRAEAINALAAEVAHNRDLLTHCSSLETAVERLCQLPGIGEWTAHYIAMRALREPDAFPATDLGLLKAMAALGQPVSKAELSNYSQRWRPWRAYAAMYLWMSNSHWMSNSPYPTKPLVNSQKEIA
jgi:AraC family transcriptional regulator of adaptative response / DNA-3-methyladenine glycosylase II